MKYSLWVKNAPPGPLAAIRGLLLKGGEGRGGEGRGWKGRGGKEREGKGEGGNLPQGVRGDRRPCTYLSSIVSELYDAEVNA